MPAHLGTIILSIETSALMARCEHYINLATELDAADNHYLELHDFGPHHYLHPVCQAHILFIYY